METGISGLNYYHPVIPTELSTRLLHFLKITSDWVGVTDNPKSRRVIQYGFKYQYGGYNKSDTTISTIDMPDSIKELRDIAISLIGVDHLNQCIINEYKPGQGIGAHIDNKYYGDTICCFSLASGIEMEFTRADHKTVKLYVQAGSLYTMFDEARYQWRHQIRPRKSDRISETISIQRSTRISITFRQVPIS